MTLSGQLFRRGAICSAVMEGQNMFSMSEQDLESSAAEIGDQVRVGVLKRGSDDTIKALDRQIFTKTLMPGGQIMVPNDAANALDLEVEDSINYIVVPKSSFPSISTGPVRDRVSGDDNDAEDIERGERQETQATFQGPKMRQTGQIKVPGEVQDSLALLRGDPVTVQVESEGQQSEVFNSTFGSGDRITIRSATREKLGLETGDEPSVTVGVTG